MMVHSTGAARVDDLMIGASLHLLKAEMSSIGRASFNLVR